MPVKPYSSAAGVPRPAPSTARIVPFAIYLAFIVVADVLGRLGYGAQDLRWLYAVKIAAVLAALIYYRRSYTELAWQRPPLRSALAALAVGLLVFVLWINLSSGWMLIGAPAGFDPSNARGGIDWPLAALRIAGAALVVPVMEELFWRSFLLRWVESPNFQAVDPARIRWKAFVVTALLFGFEHNLWLAGIVAGAAYSLLYMRTQNLWAPIAAHAVTNGALGVWIVATQNWTFW